ncbi:beta-propeller fold lactonase family protein [Hyphobacterium sp.]|uniref:YVTN family beta-propeller repeat protein n=1 Tax=Hyphobacterium sp. TaxID=2004662 RepID=UPI003BA98396
MKLTYAGLAAIAAATGALADDQIVIVNKGADTVSIIDAASYESAGDIAVGRNPHEVYVSPDGETAYISDYGNSQGTTISVIDLETATRTDVWDLQGNRGPHGIWVSNDGTLVWATTETSGTVVELSTPTGELTNVWETNQLTSHQLVPTPDDTKLYVANIGSASVTVIDRIANTVTTVRTDAGAEGIDVSPDGSEVWVTNRGADNISIIDVATDTVIDTISSQGGFPIRAKFTPDGSQVFVSNATTGSVAVFDAETRAHLGTVEVGAVPVGILISPDGGRAFIANTQDDFITVIDVATREVIDRIETGDEPDGMAWAVR